MELTSKVRGKHSLLWGIPKRSLSPWEPLQGEFSRGHLKIQAYASF